MLAGIYVGAPVKTSAQLKALVRNLSEKSNAEAEIFPRNFMPERFLKHLCVSEYKQNFILKAGRAARRLRFRCRIGRPIRSDI
jgi:hypothetical protein